jgi:putative two-component system response regulator
MEDAKASARILIVDDSLTGRMLLKEVLIGSQSGYDIDLAESCVGALDKVAAKLPDLILLDVMMPDMDGFEVCGILKKDKKTASIPILFITAMESVQGMVKGFQAGGADYITKPFIAEEIKARIAAHLRIKKAEEERLQIGNLEAIKNMVVTYNHNMVRPEKLYQTCG